jgi:hypothetical protein
MRPPGPFRLIAASTAAVIVATLAALGLPASASAIEPTASYLMPTALAFDGQPGLPPTSAKTVILPVYKGLTASGEVTWYVVTESSDAADAERRGVNFAPKLAHALGTKAVQKVGVLDPQAPVKNQVIQFAGTVDFSPSLVVVPGPAPSYFPPSRFAPGSIGDANYSPLITTGNGIVLDAPQIANDSGLNDTVVSADFTHRRATITLFQGFYEDHPVLYTRFSASDPLLAAIEGTTFTPNLNAALAWPPTTPPHRHARESSRSSTGPPASPTRSARGSTQPCSTGFRR